MNVYNKKMQGYKKLKKLLYFTKLYPIFQFQLNFPSMSFSSNFRMLISQQSSTTPVQPAELINTKMEVFFMRELRNTKIIAVDHGYGNMKTANTVTPTGIKAYETEPIFTGNILEYNGIYYRIGEGHKEFIPDKAMDEEYYLLNGHVFLYFTIEALAEVLHKSQMTVKTALAVLEKQELIFRKRQGPGHPNRIYVKIPKETLSNTDRILSSRQTENCPIDRQDSFPDTDRKLSSNKKEIKKNHLTIRGSKEPRSPYGTFQNVFLSETELENIRQTIPDWQDYMERLSGYMASTGKQYQNHAATIIRWARQDHPVSRQRNYESEEYETL